MVRCISEDFLLWNDKLSKLNLTPFGHRNGESTGALSPRRNLISENIER